MFEAALAVEAFATPPGVPDLGPTPILQVFGGIVGLMVFVIGALGWLRGERMRPPPAPPAPAPPSTTQPADTGVHLYFDGPLRQIFDDLRKLEGLILESREQYANALRETRHDIKNALHQDAIEASDELGEIASGLANLRELIVRLDEFMRHHRRG